MVQLDISAGNPEAFYWSQDTGQSLLKPRYSGIASVVQIFDKLNGRFLISGYAGMAIHRIASE